MLRESLISKKAEISRGIMKDIYEIRKVENVTRLDRITRKNAIEFAGSFTRDTTQ